MSSNFYSESDLKNYLKPFAPYSVVDRGYEMAQNSQVDECSQSGNKVAASVVDNGEAFSPAIILGPNGITAASCSCCSEEDISEQWCSHLVALSFKALEMELLNLQTKSSESFNVNQFSPEDIADRIKQAAALEYHAKKKDYFPKVSLSLKFDDYSLGVKVYHDDKVIYPEIFDNGEERSSRELDNILIQILEEEGEWDAKSDSWFINTSHSIGIVLGVSAEYGDNVKILNSEQGEEKVLRFSSEELEANISVEWQETSAELIMYWVLADQNKKILKGSGIIGDTSTWTLIDDTIYKLSASASAISSIFQFSSSQTLSKQQAGPLLEIIEKNIVPAELITIQNPESQPETEICRPEISLSIEPTNDAILDRNANFDFLKLKARMAFDYPSPEEGSNLVYLPDREFEQECIEKTQTLGFVYNDEKDLFHISADDAVDLIHDQEGKLPDSWKVSGLEEIKKAFKFSNLKVNFNVKQATDEEDDKKNIDWFDCDISLTQNNSAISLGKIFQNKHSIFDRWIQLDNGSWAKVPGGGLKKLGTTLALFAPNYKHTEEASNRISAAQAVALQNQTAEAVSVKADKKLREMAKKLSSFESIKAINPPALFKGKLRKYQKEGLSWLAFLNEYSFSGILADEMGLGKTVQTLAFIQSLVSAKSKDKRITKPVLVVAPTSVTTNWLYEAKRFTPGLSTLLLQGVKRKKVFDQIPDTNIVITSYALLRVDRSVLEKHEFSYVILDEAQYIKNPLTSTAKSAKAIKADRRLALTGTPTENRPLELWSIFDFLMPGYLGSYDFFRNQIEKPIMEEGTGADSIKILNSKTRPFILRRVKSEVEKQLPPKIESEMHVQMADSQKVLYSQILEEVRPKIMDAVDRKGVRGATISILSALLRLRQVCNHPNSIESLKDLDGYDSGKFDLLKELLRESIDSGRKILLFSQFREMLAIIRRWVDEEKINHLYLDGSTKNRHDLVDKFNMDEKVKLFLISLKAGGTGLNLTAADTVIIYDPWWNPAVESQAIDRAHRIGQNKAVNVYRLVTEDSIEQKIMTLKSKKANITDALINDNGLSDINLSKDDLDSLFQSL